MSLRLKTLFIIKVVVVNMLVFVLLYSVIELSFSSYRYFFTDTAPESFVLYEHPGETIKFDPIRGIYLTEIPSRIVRLIHGKVEYSGFFRGNAQGFADRDDFSIKRSSGSERRLAVFGDSFTTANMEPINAPNWPDRVEDLCAASGSRNLVLLNFGVDAGGLANWASILRGIVVKDKYEVDGLVFAVAWDDLDRKFAMFDQIDPKRFMYARASSWDVSAQPRTRSEALSLLEKDTNPGNRYVVSPSEFDAYLAGHWWPRVWKFRVTERIVWLHARSKFGIPKPIEGFEAGQLALIDEIRRLAEENSWPIAVAYIPNREELLDPGALSRIEKCKRFSELLGATFLDGREAFRGLSRQQILEDWFRVDGHWNRGGSDRFADFMASRLQSWIVAGGSRAPILPDRSDVVSERAVAPH